MSNRLEIVVYVMFRSALALSIFTFSLFSISALAVPITDRVTADGREWAQLDLFAGISSDDINAVCPDGVCSPGQLNGYDMAGWQWASLEETFSLFNTYLGAEILSVGGTTSCSEEDSDWVPTFFSDGWRPVIRGPLTALVVVTSTPIPGVGGWSVGIAGNVLVPFPMPDFVDTLETSGDGSVALPFPQGAYFYSVESTTGVPLPGTAALLLLAIARPVVVRRWVLSDT